MKKNSPKPRIYAIATAHLDTSWHWTLEESVREYLPDTCRKNFELLEKYPQYVFNFEGAYRYELIKEYYPEYFEKIRAYAHSGRWYPCGSAYENGDTNIPSPEALFRNILYGSDFFKKEFTTEQNELFLPDCFGFSYALPSVASHAGLYGFSTQKLPIVGGRGIPFDIGKWYGPDGSFIYASLDNFNYGFRFKKGVRSYHHAKTKLRENANRYSVPFASLYHGTGDKGGSPDEQSVKIVCNEAEKNSESTVDVIPAKADSMFSDLKALPKRLTNTLPEWHNELIATDHGAGCYTARSCSKRWNRLAEQLLFSAEAFANAARLTGSKKYSEEVFNRSWKSVIAHQFHDDITGTGAMECSERAWNDYAIAAAAASEELYASGESIAKKLDTSFCKGTPIVVLSGAGTGGRRTDGLTLRVKCKPDTECATLYDSNGAVVPCGFHNTGDGYCNLSFTADVPSFGVSVYDLIEGEACECDSLIATKNKLENEFLRVLIDGNGDICSVYSKEYGFEALSAPIRYNLLDFNGVTNYPAWELVYRETVHAPAGYPVMPETEVIECSPARAAIKVTRRYNGSRFTEIISLARGGRRCDVKCEVDWRSPRSLLKVAFPLTIANDYASYDLGLGYINRAGSDKTLYEFPAQNWADISSRRGSTGVSVLSNSRTGWDKPSDNTLRLTAVFSPKVSRGKDCSQQLLDFGINRFDYSVLPHRGNSLNETQREGMHFNSPLCAFTADKHPGAGRELTLCELSGDGVLLRAFKKALNSDATVVRINEGNGKAVEKAMLSLPSGTAITQAFEADARENIIGDAKPVDGKLVFSLKQFEVKTFLLITGEKAPQESSVNICLPLDTLTATTNGEHASGILSNGLSLPKELIPPYIRCSNAYFTLSSEGLALRPHGEKIRIDAGTKSVYLLAGSVCGDREALFSAGGIKTRVTVPDMLERFATWDMLALNKTGYVKDAVPAYTFTHTHSPEGDVYCKHAYLFLIKLPVGEGEELILPDDDNILIFAAASSEERLSERAVMLTESLKKRDCDFIYTDEEQKKSIPTKREIRITKRRKSMRYVRIRLKRELASFRRK